VMDAEVVHDNNSLLKGVYSVHSLYERQKQ
jgi:hypothetical protein